MKNVKIIEIDDNNNSNCFKDVNFKAVSVSTNEGDEALQDALFEQMSSDCSIVLDSGGGNDARKVLKMLEDNNESDNFTFIIPLGNSRTQVQNAKDTFDLINRKDQCIFILNQVHDLKNVEKEFMFFFGNDVLGIDSLFNINEIKYLALEYTPCFELAALGDKTIFELASIAKNLKSKNIRQLFFEKSDGDKNEFKRLYSQYKQSLMAAEFIDENYPPLLEILKGASNVALASTKGGVGKSTIGWHLITRVLQDNNE